MALRLLDLLYGDLDDWKEDTAEKIVEFWQGTNQETPLKTREELVQRRPQDPEVAVWVRRILQDHSNIPKEQLRLRCWLDFVQIQSQVKPVQVCQADPLVLEAFLGPCVESWLIKREEWRLTLQSFSKAELRAEQARILPLIQKDFEALLHQVGRDDLSSLATYNLNNTPPR